MDRTIRWDGFHNTRDLGGLPTRDGTTRRGAFYRGADPRFVTAAGWAQARAAGVRTVIDLRNPAEIPPDPPPPGLIRMNVPIDDADDMDFWEYVRDPGLDGSPLYYPLFLERKAARCAELVETLARAAPGGVLFHCVSGRDRAGLTALLLLSLAGVEPEAIAADYALSTEAVQPLYAALGVEDQGSLIASLLAQRGTTTTGAVLAALDGFDAREYLLAAGVSGAALDDLRRRLVAPAR